MALASPVEVEGKRGKGKKRKADYSEEENLFIAEMFDELKDVLERKHKNVNTNRKKKDAWEVILTQHMARFPTTNRTMGDLKNRLSKLKSESKDHILQCKKSRNKTGGGKAGPEPTTAQQKIIALCEDTPAFQGLDGVESGVEPTSSFEVVAAGMDEDDAGEDTTEAVPSTSNSQAASAKSIPPAKVPHKFDELIDIEKENLLIKRQNLLLKQEELKLQIELLKRNVGNSETVKNGDKVYFAL